MRSPPLPDADQPFWVTPDVVMAISQLGRIAWLTIPILLNPKTSLPLKHYWRSPLRRTLGGSNEFGAVRQVFDRLDSSGRWQKEHVQMDRDDRRFATIRIA